VQSRDVPLRDAVRRVDSRRISRLDEVLGDDVDHAFARLGKVAQRVLCLLERSHKPDHKQRRVVVDDLRVAERRQVGRIAVLGSGADQPDRSGDYARDQELVVRRGFPPLLVRVDLDVVLLQTRPAVIRAVALLPLWAGGLRERDFSLASEVRSRCLDLAEIVADFEHGGRGAIQSSVGRDV
jgi:hypothetical protein